MAIETLHCPYCREEIKLGALKCKHCKTMLSEGASAASQAEAPNSAQAGGEAEAPAIWNPNAAANWSILLTPAFGAWLVAKNWSALGRPESAKKAMGWFYGSLIFLIVATFAKLGPTAWLLLIVWYLFSAREQAKFVKTGFGKHYPRKGWLKPILIGLGAELVVFVVLGTLLSSSASS